MQSALVRSGRRRAVKNFVDTVIVTRVVGTVEDPDTGRVSDVTETIYPLPSWPADHKWKHGPAKRQTYEAYEQSPQAGAHVYTVQRYSAHFPVGSFIPAPGDIITWLTARNDPDLPGTVDRVTGLFNKTAASSMRVFVDELVA